MTFDRQGYTRQAYTDHRMDRSSAHPVPDQGGLMDRFPERRIRFKAACTPKIRDRHRFSKNHMSTLEA